MNLLVKDLKESKKFKDFLKNIENKKSPVEISGISCVPESLIISAVLENIKRPILLLTYNEIEAQKLVSDLKFFTDKVSYLPKKEIIIYD